MICNICNKKLKRNEDCIGCYFRAKQPPKSVSSERSSENQQFITWFINTFPTHKKYLEDKIDSRYQETITALKYLKENYEKEKC